MIDLVAGNTGCAIQFSCVDNFTLEPINLSNYQVTIHWKGNTQNMEVIDSLNGIVRYHFYDNELVSGNMSFDIILTNKLSKEQITNKDVIRLTVRQRV